ncbi:reverse transcriptase domain-containing protein [Tanacetum coccineum]
MSLVVSRSIRKGQCSDAKAKVFSGLDPTTVTTTLDTLGDTLGNESAGLASSPTCVPVSANNVTKGQVLTENTKGSVSFAKLISSEPSRKNINFRTLLAHADNGDDVGRKCFDNSVYGFFLGKRVAYLVGKNYVKNTWSNYGLVKSMMNSSNWLFLFKFSSKDRMEAMLENGHCVPVWVKFHDVPITAFSEDGLGAIAIKLGTPLMLDSYTIVMCMKSWRMSSYARDIIELRADVECSSYKVFGHVLDEYPKKIVSDVYPRQAVRGVQRDGEGVGGSIGTPFMLDSYTIVMCMKSWRMSSYARDMIELRADVELEDIIVVVVPKLVGEGFFMCTIHIEYEWKHPKCSSYKVFGHVLDEYPKKIVSDVYPRQAVRGVQPYNEPTASNAFSECAIMTDKSGFLAMIVHPVRPDA